MTKDEADCRSVQAGLAGLSVFAGLREHPLIAAFEALLSPAADTGHTDDRDAHGRRLALVGKWAHWTRAFALHAGGAPFHEALHAIALADVNEFTLQAERGSVDKNSFVSRIAANDLVALFRAARFDFEALARYFAASLDGGGPDGWIARVKAEARLFPKPPETDERWTLGRFADFIRKNGAGDFADGTPLCFSEGKLRPAANSDPVRLSDLSGCEEQRAVIVANTVRLLSGSGANNILLYGDRGCGKSAAVKAVCNEYAARGLRLVELKKADLAALPDLMSALARRGLRFVIFIDDLSFEDGDSGFMALKAVLEGGVEAKPPNVAVYATSNRRHLVKEPRSGRPAAHDDARAFDTMQEQLSLADRFGLTVIFAAPSQDEYLRVAEFLARKRRLLTDGASEAEVAAFRDNAVRWERWFNGRSPRTAVQFVDWLSGGEGFPWEAPVPFSTV